MISRHDVGSGVLGSFVTLFDRKISFSMVDRG